ncbi:putative tetraspanin protein [Phaeoacremonium minimum UCRPA7]|uniref:Putative tetraspanin protein n=1 Tax=Phaeoacremonium minimum (strain UCR-PA7) TaxID=1286976 RepID=R8BII1_PHAM7|nr:putative tetraspanin protein [Phaeoacremonium minimum UCRPA7]EON99047.1 putative tetraspanin protein [Phaeoacremonium minimum UCRPA7]
MANKVLMAYVAADVLFVAMGAVMLGFSIIVKNSMFDAPTTGGQAARNILYQQFPLTAGIVNSIFVFVTFAATIPAITMPTRGWLKVSGYMATITALFSVIVGLYLWILTLKSKETLAPLWRAATAQTQELMQTEFACCGYFNSSSPAFITDATCPSPAAAAMVRGCASPLASFANVFVDDIFTAVFGMAGIDALLIVATACLLKERKEMERFRHIDEKSGYRGI